MGGIALDQGCGSIGLPFHLETFDLKCHFVNCNVLQAFSSCTLSKIKKKKVNINVKYAHFRAKYRAINSFRISKCICEYYTSVIFETLTNPYWRAAFEQGQRRWAKREWDGAGCVSPAAGQTRSDSVSWAVRSSATGEAGAVWLVGWLLAKIALLKTWKPSQSWVGF